MSPRRPAGHPDWCAADHRCNLAEHRSAPIVADVPGAGRLVLTRVRDTTGRDHAEIRMSVALPNHERDAQSVMVALLTHMRTLIGPARRTLPRGRAA